MRNQIFGLSKRPIDQLVKKMAADFSMERSQLEHEIEVISKEKERLLAELKNISEINLANENERDFWEAGKERLEIVLKHLNDQKNLELSAIMSEFDEQMGPLTQQLHDLDNEIKANENLLNKLLTNIDGLVEQSQTDLLSPKFEEKEFVELTEEVKQTEMLEFEFDSAKKENSPVIPKETKKGEVDNFWGDLGEWVVDAIQTKQIFKPADLDFAADSNEGGQLVHQPEGKSEAKKLETDPLNVEHDNVLVEQIDSIKSMYIVGKLAGEDLFDQNGNLIVSKYSFITKEVVDKANRAGKLADLIVNMKLSGSGVG